MGLIESAVLTRRLWICTLFVTCTQKKDFFLKLISSEPNVKLIWNFDTIYIFMKFSCSKILGLIGLFVIAGQPQMCIPCVLCAQEKQVVSTWYDPYVLLNGNLEKNQILTRFSCGENLVLIESAVFAGQVRTSTPV